MYFDPVADMEEDELLRKYWDHKKVTSIDMWFWLNDRDDEDDDTVSTYDADTSDKNKRVFPSSGTYTYQRVF